MCLLLRRTAAFTTTTTTRIVRRCATTAPQPTATTDEATYSSAFIKEFVARGYLHQCTDLEYLDTQMASDSIAAYLGFDATASSLHVGSLLQIMVLRLLQRTGHKPIVLVGGGTTRVGDPSGKDESRKMLDDATIQANVDGITSIFSKFLSFGDGPTDAVLVNNADWLEELKYVDFLRDFGPHFSVNRMLTFDSVKTRLSREQPLSFLEFNYVVLQAYDFLELGRRHGVTVQLGGSDQWGNIVSGVELGRRIDGAKLVGLTAPLVATADGKKMGKTADGAVWLTADRLPPYDYWQFWRNVADADVRRFFKLFTEVPVDEIDSIDLGEAPAINAAKRRLADETTALLHGSDALPPIHAAVDALFGAAGTQQQMNAALPKLSLLSSLADGNAVPVADLLVRLQFAKSKGEAKRLITQGGARLQDVKITDVDATISTSNFADLDALKISAGKKRHALLTLDDDDDDEKPQGGL
ncbi:hypothetical protein CTAYLR_002254 [Chrysophaeum taylorii]|uniref:Tyrosine--tRNA ligase n=1 Tax=Chrysophaeum taylorii TaxID=2483200 RepID=A0AAD7UPQ0_9STRA|nr:hypothetical protein CTAYLR_002254 [Chrysophaeum taylorii]